MDTGPVPLSIQSESTASFGYWVRRRRLALDLTQAELARRVGCARITISKIERDERRPSHQMAELLVDRLSIPEKDRDRFLAVALGERAVDVMPLSDEPVDAPATPGDQPPPRNLPTPSTPFVGRKAELAQLLARLEDPACRLLTLVGPGGFGKTRLGIRLGELAFERSTLAPDGVYFVALDGLESPAWVVPAIAAALGFTFHEQEEQEKQLLSYLRNRRLLLILDNAEGILDSDLIVRVVRYAHDLKLLVTTRVALNVREEWFHPVVGMKLDGEDDRQGGSGAGYLGDAVEFFKRCAVRVQPDFDLEHEVGHVRAICRTVGGVPLAIELAAAWLKALTCEQVARELVQGIDILTSSMHDVPDRHRSLRVVLEQSWHYLSDEEQRVFRQLSIFAGGFRRAAAQAVTGATLPVLASLVDKSVLQFGQDGRYRIHALLRQMGGDRLAADPDEADTVAKKHCTYYSQFLSDRIGTIAGPNQRRVLLEVEAETENILRAWAYAARHSEFEDLQAALPCLLRFLWVRGRYEDGQQLLAVALDALKKEPFPENEKVLRITLLARSALFAAATGETERAKTVLAEAQSDIDPAKISTEKALCDYVAGMIYTYDYVPNAPNAYEPLKAAHEAYQALGDAAATAETALRLAFIESGVFGDFAKSGILVEKSLKIYRELGDLAGIADALHSMGRQLFASGDYDRAERCFIESRQIARNIDNKFLVARTIGGSAHLAEVRLQWDLAIRLGQEQVERLQDLGLGYWSHVALGELGGKYADTKRYDAAIEIYETYYPFICLFPWIERVLIAVGRYAEALGSLQGLAAKIMDGERRWYTADNLTSCALLLKSDCQLRRNEQPFSRAARNRLAQEILTLVRDYDPDRSYATSRQRAAHVLAELEEQDVAVEPAVVPDNATPRSVEEIARELLTLSLA